MFEGSISYEIRQNTTLVKLSDIVYFIASAPKKRVLLL